MTTTDELIAILGYKIEGEGNLRKFKQGLDRTEKEAHASASRFGVIGASIGARLGAAIGVGATAAFTRQAYTSFAQFDRQMTRVGITAGASAFETKEAGLQVTRLAQNFALPIESAVGGLDTLVASGMDLKEAMAFLPSVLMTAQAAGAATEDIANTAQKASSALNIQSAQMQDAFDIMVTGGKAGQFELKDMASYIPELGSAFAALGYKGLPGLKTLIAALQTLRMNTGTAGAASTQALNIFQKMFSNETANNFKKMGVNLPASLKKAKENGEGLLEAFIRITDATIKGDLTKLPQLINDAEFQSGVRTLLTSGDKFKDFMRILNGPAVSGAALQDFGRVADDTSAKIQGLSNSWGAFMNAVGEDSSSPLNAASRGLSHVLDRLTANVEKNNAVQRGFDKAGLSADERRAFLTRATADDIDRASLIGGYVPRPGEKTVADHIGSSEKELARLRLADAQKREDARLEIARLEKATDVDTGAPAGGIFTARPEVEAQRRKRFEEQRQQRLKALEAQTQAADPEIAKIEARLDALRSIGGGAGVPQAGANSTGAVPFPVPRPSEAGGRQSQAADHPEIAKIEARLDALRSIGGGAGVQQGAPAPTGGVPFPIPRPSEAGGRQSQAPQIQLPDWAMNILQNMAEIGRQGANGGAEAVVNDNRTTTNTVTVQAPVTVNVQQATQAPSAVGNAVAGAVRSGVQAQPTRMQQGPVQ